MTYRGIVRNGMVVLDKQGELPDGTAVAVTPLNESSDDKGDLPSFGLWRDRADMTDSGEASLKLRASLS